MPTEEMMEIHGDVLEAVLTHVPLVHLVSAARVSREWSDAVFSSLSHLNRPRPWLIIHKQATRPPYATATRAYDPRSGAWISVSRPSIEYISDLKSSHSNFAYMLSPSRFSFSSDPLNLEWIHADPPLVWRRDPIVARVGDHVVVAGGGCDFEDDPLAVEIYDLKNRDRFTCDSMPATFRDSASSLSLSVAAMAEKLVVTDKETGLTHWFDPGTRSWSGAFHLRPGQSQTSCSYMIGVSIDHLILLEVRKIDGSEKLKVYRFFDVEDLACEEIGEMPLELAAKLRSESMGHCCLNIRSAGNIIYVYNTTWDVEEVAACELVADGGCRWWSVKDVVAREELIRHRIVLTCSEVGIGELQRLMQAGNPEVEIGSTSSIGFDVVDYDQFCAGPCTFVNTR